MGVISKQIENEDGTKETLVISSENEEVLKLNGTYKIANHSFKKENALVKKFKGTILGADIGVKSGGFTNVAILAVVIALSAFIVMYFMWRF